MNLGNPLILVTFLPLVGFLIILLLKPEQKNAIRAVALATTLAVFGASLWLLAQFQPQTAGLQLVVKQIWLTLGGMPVQFFMGVDGISILMVLLTALLTPIAILSTWSAVQERVKGFMLFFLLLVITAV